MVTFLNFLIHRHYTCILQYLYMLSLLKVENKYFTSQYLCKSSISSSLTKSNITLMKDTTDFQYS